jgi:hypothetical protein
VFGANQRPEQVNEQSKRNDSDNDVFHGLKPPTGVGVNDAGDEKRERRRYEYEVGHNSVPFGSRAVLKSSFLGAQETGGRCALRPNLPLGGLIFST